jgi:aspartyl aminopeptidase
MQRARPSPNSLSIFACTIAHRRVTEARATNSFIQVMVLFDHEEIGSVSAQGAESNLLVTFLERIALSLGLTREAWLSLLPRSFIVSADMAHGIHPNYPDRHEPDHFPQLNKGVVLKSNAGLRYASDGFSSARFLGWARRAGVETQRFINRTDLGCGTTVGPGLSAQLGIPTVDAGTPMLSMHSAREMCGAGDHGQMISVLKAFYLGG